MRRKRNVIISITLCIITVLALVSVGTNYLAEFGREHRALAMTGLIISKFNVPNNFHLISTSSGIISYPPDTCLGLSGKVPQKTYDYIVKVPMHADVLASELRQDLDKTGFKTDLSVYPRFYAYKGTSDMSGQSVEVTFNGNKTPYSADYMVYAARFVVQGEELQTSPSCP